ncbi:hypothetical protein ACWCPI_25775 [Streptomyces sp. NPDC001920]
MATDDETNASPQREQSSVQSGEEGDGAPRKRSVILSVTILVGLALIIAGAVFALLGLGNVGIVTGKGPNGVELKTTSLGVVMMVIGATFAGFVATNLPEGFEVFGEREESVWARILRLLTSRGVRPYLIVLGIAVIFLLLGIILS